MAYGYPHDIPDDCRAVIVVDSCALAALDVAIPGERLHTDAKDKPKKYIGIVERLAAEGYYVIIPEMVAYESARLTSEGSPDKYFPKKNGIEKREVPVWAVDFISKAFKNPDKNIAVWPPRENDHSKPAKFIRAIKKFMHENPDPNAVNNIAMQHLQQTEPHGGKMAGLDIVKDVLKNTSHPVCFFTNDTGTKIEMEKIQKKYPERAAYLNVKGFWWSVVESKLAAALGFKELDGRWLEYRVEKLCRYIDEEVADDKKPLLFNAIDAILKGKLTTPPTEYNIHYIQDALASAIKNTYKDPHPLKYRPLDAFLEDLRIRMGNEYPLADYTNTSGLGDLRDVLQSDLLAQKPGQHELFAPVDSTTPYFQGISFEDNDRPFRRSLEKMLEAERLAPEPSYGRGRQERVIGAHARINGPVLDIHASSSR